ncbi:MAG: helix-turn-helix domain-containing protein [bacterium]
MTRLGSYLRRLRQEKGMTLAEVAKVSGISIGYISDLERSEQNNPHPSILKKLASVYGAPLQELMEAAGYLVRDEKPPVFSEKDRVNWAFHVVLSDPDFSFFIDKGRARFLSLEQKKKLVETYQTMTGKKLLP